MALLDCKFLLYSLLYIYSYQAVLGQQQPECLDEDGNAVDWLMAYKFPHLTDDGHPLNTGLAYSYISGPKLNSAKAVSWRDRLIKTISNFWPCQDLPKVPIDTIDEWILSKKLITDQKSAIMRTLRVAYGAGSDNIESIYYNDGPPLGHRRGDSKRAHAKGIVLMNAKTGGSIWVTHSMPQFPPPRGEPLEFHNNSDYYGQTFMCIGFDARKSGQQIIDHLVVMYPLIYDFRLSDEAFALIPDLKKLPLKRNRQRKQSDIELKQVIATKAGQEIHLYSKSSKFGDDLYSGWLDHELFSNLFVQTWRRGSGGVINSTCPNNDFHVNNILDLGVNNENLRKSSWSYLDDHSKWAISEHNNPGFVCINDINRMKSQFQRGGGAACMVCQSCWKVFYNTIIDLEPCGGKMKRNQR